jgi:hypothetical protein
VEPTATRSLQQAMLDVSGSTATMDGTGFIEALEAHFFDQFSVKLAAMTLARVGTYAVRPSLPTRTTSLFRFMSV